MKLADIFCDNLVFQRNKKICIFGMGTGCGTVEFCGKTTEFVSETEAFRVYIPEEDAGGPYDMKITLNGETKELKNIMVGDVYIAAGQSNMEFKLKSTADIVIRECENIRFFEEPNDSDNNMNVTYNNKGWRTASGDEPLDFSAVAYYFACELYEKTKIPVGIISCNKGASRVDAWTAPEITNTEEYKKFVQEKHTDYDNYKFNQDNWLYKNKLIKIVPYAVNGVLWYQGESNAHHAEAVHYDKMLEAMIDNWRTLWEDNLSFYLVQLMPHPNSNPAIDWAAIREMQEKVSKCKDNVYLTTLVDTGEALLIHPTRKKEVAHALANAVLFTKFRVDTEYCGPVWDYLEKTEHGIRIHFKHAEDLRICGKYLTDTYVYDMNGSACTVDSEVNGNTLSLKWNADIVPRNVAMGYSNNPTHNLFNSQGFMASPFNIFI